jgi:hypothetical protein
MPPKATARKIAAEKKPIARRPKKEPEPEPEEEVRTPVFYCDDLDAD